MDLRSTSLKVSIQLCNNGLVYCIAYSDQKVILALQSSASIIIILIILDHDQPSWF